MWLLRTVSRTRRSQDEPDERTRERLAQREHAPLSPETLANRAQRRTTAERPRDLARQMHQRIARYSDMFEVARRDTGARETPSDCGGREPGLVLDASEPLFLGGCHDLAVDQERGRRVTVIRIDAEDDHSDSFSSLLAHVAHRDRRT
jgi:hypothetical protein